MGGIGSGFYPSNKRRVKCLTNNRVYESIIDAYMDTGVDPSDICKTCQGKKRTAGKLRWEYIKT